MSKQTEANRFIVSPLASKSAGFYQEILQRLDNYERLGNRLIKLADQAHAFRQFDQLKEYGQILSNSPIKSYQVTGCYYLAVAANSRGNGDQEAARKLFEFVAEAAPQKYRAKAILSLAALSLHAGDYNSQFRFLIEAGRASSDLSTAVRAHLGLAIYKSMEGFHQQSLRDLEDLYRLARLSQPIVFFDYLNSLAVELGEAGRAEEAGNICKVILASPFAPAYPEWRETAEDLKLANRSLVAIGSRAYVPRKVLSMPARQHETIEQGQQAKLFSFQAWKNKMAKKKEKPPQNKKEMLMRVIDILTSDETSDYERHKIYEAVEKIIAGRYNPKPDGDEYGA